MGENIGYKPYKTPYPLASILLPIVVDSVLELVCGLDINHAIAGSLFLGLIPISSHKENTYSFLLFNDLQELKFANKA